MWSDHSCFEPAFGPERWTSGATFATAVATADAATAAATADAAPGATAATVGLVISTSHALDIANLDRSGSWLLYTVSAH